MSGGTPSISESLLPGAPCWFSHTPRLHQRQTWSSVPHRHTQTEETSHWAPPVIWHTSTHTHRHALHAYNYQNVLYIPVQSHDEEEELEDENCLKEKLQIIMNWTDAKKIHSQTNTWSSIYKPLSSVTHTSVMCISAWEATPLQHDSNQQPSPIYKPLHLDKACWKR